MRRGFFLHKSPSGIFSACTRQECGQNRSADLSRARGYLNLKPAPGVLLGIHGGGVLPCSLNPDPLSDKKMLQSTPDNSNIQVKSKKVRVIGSLKQITGSKEMSKWMGRKGN